MAYIKKKSGGFHITGRDVAVAKLAERYYNRIKKESKDQDLDDEESEEIVNSAIEKAQKLIAFDKRAYRNIHNRSIWSGIRHGIGTKAEVARNALGRFIGRTIKPSSLPEDFSSSYISSLGTGYTPFQPMSMLEAEAFKAEERAKSPIGARIEEHKKRMQEYRTNPSGAVLADRLAKENWLKNQRLNIHARAIEANRIANNQKRFEASKEYAKLADTENDGGSITQENTRQRKNTAEGIRAAFGGKELKLLRALLWTGTAARFVRATIGTALATARDVNATDITASAVGSTFSELRSMGNVARIFGGNEKDAASLLATINKLTSGALVGAGLGPLGTAALRYGLDITGSGRGGLATPDEILDRIADLLKSYEGDPGMQAMIAGDIGLAPAMLEAMKEGSTVFREKLGEQITLSQNQVDLLKKSAQAQGELANAWKLWKESWGVEFTGFTKSVADFLKRDAEKRINPPVKNPPMAWPAEHTIQTEEEFWMNYLHSGVKEVPAYSIKTYNSPWRSSFPSLSNTPPSLNIDFNFGDIELTPLQKAKGVEAVRPWLEDVLSPVFTH